MKVDNWGQLESAGGVKDNFVFAAYCKCNVPHVSLAFPCVTAHLKSTTYF